jgi:cardiolipin synthase A/B
MNVIAQNIYWVIGVSHYVIVVGLILTLIYEERDPSTTLAWVLMLVLLPLFGIIAYVLFGRNWRIIARGDRKRIAALKRGDETLAPIYARHESDAKVLETMDPPLIGRLVSAIHNQNGTCPLPCYDLEIFATGAEKFDRLYRDIEAASDHVHLEYFIWEQDTLTERFCNLLAEKVRQGVEVRVLYDWVGSIGYGKKQLRALERAGAQVAADAAKWTRLNYRNHRKIVVIDGRVAYTGGMNMGQEYIDGKPRYASWRDTSIRFGGPLVADLQRLFAQRWLRVKGEDTLSERYFPSLEAEPASNMVWAQVVHSGPEYHWQAIQQAFLIAIASAEKSVQIQSPYFVPDQAIESVIVSQSLAGVQTRLMMTGVPDKQIPWWAAFTYIDEVVEAGGRVFQYSAGFFHPKTMTIDGSIAIIGTTNFDIRSFALHDELSIVFYDEGVAASQDAIFEDDVAKSAEVTPADLEAVGRIRRMRNALARLSSRML